MASFFFYLLAAIMVLASLAVVRSRQPLYNVLSLVVVIFCLSSLFVLLEAYFVGIILLLVYAGAVLVFFLFVVMCLNLSPEAPVEKRNRMHWLGWAAAFMFACEVFLALKSTLQAQALGPTSMRGTIEVIGQILFTDYLLPFELTSFLLLIAIFGIVSLAKGALDTGGKA